LLDGYFRKSVSEAWGGKTRGSIFWAVIGRIDRIGLGDEFCLEEILKFLMKVVGRTRLEM
jgi:hypothetical protein